MGSAVRWTIVRTLNRQGVVMYLGTVVGSWEWHLSGWVEWSFGRQYRRPSARTLTRLAAEIRGDK